MIANHPTSNASVRSLLIAMSLLLPLHSGVAADTAKSTGDTAATEKKLIEARKRLGEAAREVADLSVSISDDAFARFIPFVGPNQNAVLGLVIGGGRDEELTDGVKVLSVSPGGAAATAGIQAGDVLTELNGKSLKMVGEDSPRSRLRDIMNDVKPGAKVKVGYRRGSKVQTASVVAQAPVNRPFSVAGPGTGMPGLRNFAFFRSRGVFGSAEMVALTPQLGRYFGTDKGLLIVRAPGDDSLKLEEGDVIIDIDGRIPENAAHASRILESYEAGEKLRLNVLRMKQKVTLDIDVPATPDGARFERSRFAPIIEHGVITTDQPLIPLLPPPPPGPEV